MKWKLIIFDLDGTLVDTIEDLGTAVNHALESRGFPLHAISEYKSMVGHGVRNLVWKAMPEQLNSDEALLDELLASFLDYYSSHIDVHTRPYQGMVELLDELQASGAKLAVASNKFQAGTSTIIERLFPSIHFSAVFGGRSGVPLKPDPAVIATILDSCGESREDSVMVGDSGTDIATARAGGVTSVAVSWGFRPREAVQDADHLVDSPAELRNLLLG